MNIQLDNFLSPDASIDELPRLDRYTGIRGHQRKIFQLIDDKTVIVHILLYAAKLGKNSDEVVYNHINGIAIITSDGDLVAENIAAEQDVFKWSTSAQVELFNALVTIDSFPEFADKVNDLGRAACSLRFEL